MTTAPFTTGWPPGWPLPRGRAPMPTSPGTPLAAWIEGADTGQDWLQQRLFDNRMVLVHGIVDRAAATRLTGQLLALDAAAQRPIRVHIDSLSADLTAALLVADTLDLVGVSTYGLVIGEVGGASLAVLMATDHRSACPHARLRLSEPRADRTPLLGDASEAARQHADLLADFVDRLARATHKSANAIQAERAAGATFRHPKPPSTASSTRLRNLTRRYRAPSSRINLRGERQSARLQSALSQLRTMPRPVTHRARNG